MLNLLIKPMPLYEYGPRVVVIGVGGAGRAAADAIIDAGLEYITVAVADTDGQAMMQSRASERIQLGPDIGRGFGGTITQDEARVVAEAESAAIERLLGGAFMVFVVAGLGGGTGSGAAPVIAAMAKQRNILTVAIVTMPFESEGADKDRAAKRSVAELRRNVDALIVLPHEKLSDATSETGDRRGAFAMGARTICTAVRGVIGLPFEFGMVNVPFADIRQAMFGMGMAVIGIGEAVGEDSALRAAERALSHPILKDSALCDMDQVLISIISGDDTTLWQGDCAQSLVRDQFHEDADIGWGWIVDESMNGKACVMVVAGCQRR